MKKLMLIIAAVLIACVGMAQKKERTNAFMYNKNGQLDKAKTSIEKAIVHDQTINDARTWEYAGIIYYNISVSPEFQSIDPDALMKSFEAFKKCIELDPQFANENAQDIVPRVNAVATMFFQKGVEGFNTADFTAAAKNFKTAYDVYQMIGKQDMDSFINAALASVRSQQYDQAIDYYTQIQALGADDADSYKYLASAYKGKGDNAKMMEVISAGRAKYPDDGGLLIEEINALLEQGKSAEVIDPLKLMIQKDSTNSSIYFILGTVYGDESKTELYNIDSAKYYYKRAITYDSTMYDAIYNLGSIYISQYNVLSKQANDLPLSQEAKYNAIMKEADAYLIEGLPYLERVYANQPDETVKAILKTVYIHLKMNDKASKL